MVAQTHAERIQTGRPGRSHRLTGFEAGRCRKELREARIALDQLEADIDAAVAAGGGAR